MLFRQLVTRKTDRLTYLVACPRSREAILVDPIPGEELRYRSLLQGLLVQLTWVVDTALPETHSGIAPYASLLDFLGTGEEVRGRRPLHEELGAPRIGPLARLPDDADPLDHLSDEAQEIELGDGTRAIPICATAPPQRGSALPLRVGGLQVELWCPAPNQLVVQLADRVIVAQPPRAGAEDPEEPLLPALAALPPDTLLFPRRAPNGIRVTSVAQERDWGREPADARPSMPPLSAPPVNDVPSLQLVPFPRRARNG